MGRWLELADRLEAEACAVSVISADREASDTIDTIGTAPAARPMSPSRNLRNNSAPIVPADIVDGVARLGGQPAPRISNPPVWPEIVADAQRLVADGWAAKAMALGWSALDLFGACGDVGHQDDNHGLAVWLARRRLLAINETIAVVSADIVGVNVPALSLHRLLFNRRDMTGCVLLWELRDIQRERMRGVS